MAPFWGDLTPDDVSIAKTLEYEKLRQRNPWTVRRELGVLQAALNHAVVALRLTNPPKIKLPEKPAPLDRWLTKDEVNRLLRHAPPHLQRFIKISLCTGRRKKAVLDLRWSRSTDKGWIDLDRKIIEFKGTNQTESSKRRGSIAMPDPLLELAVEWEQDGNPSVIHFDGKPLKDIKSSFRKACSEAGLSDVTPHTLKYTAVTWAFQGGMSVEDAYDYFATSIDTLLDVYRKHSPEHQARAARIMSQIGDHFVANNVA
ncbi:MAG: site-specific integrase [Pseudomonadota bacterium]